MNKQDLLGDDALKIFSSKVVVQPTKPFFVNPRFRFQTKITKHPLQSGSDLSQHEGISTFEVGETSKNGAHKAF